MPSDCPIGIFWPLYRLSYFDLCLLITPLESFGHCMVCPTLIYAFWLPLDSMPKKWQTDNQKAQIEVGQTIQWPQDTKGVTRRHQSLLIIPLVSFANCIVCPTLIYAFWLPHWYLLAIVSSVLLRFMPSDYPFRIIWDDTMATRYQRGNQKASIEEAQTIQWPKGTKGIIRRHKSK
jgi:hypothetical protein